MTRLLLGSLVLLCIAAPGAAQTLLMRAATAPTLLEVEGGRATPPVPLVPPDGAWHAGSPPPPPLPYAFPLERPEATARIGSATAFPLGDLAFDNERGLVIETDGYGIAVHEHECYLPTGAVAPVTMSYAPAWLGALTGIAVDASQQRLWCTDGAYFLSAATAAPSTPLGLPMAFGFTLLAAPMTGLDWDPIGQHLVGCDVAGNVYRFTTLGAPVGPQPWIAGSGHGSQATDVAVPHMPTGSSSPTAWVQVRNRAVQEFNSGSWGTVPDSQWPANNFAGTEAGLAVHYNSKTYLFDCGCPHGMFRMTKPSTFGQTQFGFALQDLPPGTPTFLLLDVYRWSPWVPGQSPCFYNLRVSPAPMLAMFALTGPDGRAVMPVPLSISTVWTGLELYAQMAFFCQGSDPIGVSSWLHFQLARP